jgi:3(or 17)beta-hydroxysteroid dehydrogenase
MGRVEGKVAIVTGGSRGIGGASARRLAEEGAKVTIADIDEKNGEALAAAIGADFTAHDVSDEKAWEPLISGVTSKHGGLHILVNAAGISGDFDFGTPENCTTENWRRVLSINLDGAFFACRAALAPMRDSGGGSIVNISSIISYIAAPFSVAYGASKAGVAHLTKSVALYAGAMNPIVRCNSVHPGLIRTDLFNNVLEGISKRRSISVDDALADALTREPSRELGEPEDVAQLVLFLASDESSYITGTPFKIDAGWTLD